MVTSTTESTGKPALTRVTFLLSYFPLVLNMDAETRSGHFFTVLELDSGCFWVVRVGVKMNMIFVDFSKKNP